MKKYIVESKNFYSGWNSVKSFDFLKDAVDFKKNILPEKDTEHRIVSVETVTETYERRQMVIEKS